MSAKVILFIIINYKKMKDSYCLSYLSICKQKIRDFEVSDFFRLEKFISNHLATNSIS